MPNFLRALGREPVSVSGRNEEGGWSVTLPFAPGILAWYTIRELNLVFFHASVLAQRGTVMRKIEEVVLDEPFEELLTIKELAAKLGVSYKRAAAIVTEKELPFRFATKQEEDALLEDRRIDGLPATHPPGKRIKLIPRFAVATAQNRKSLDWKPWLARTR